VYRLVCGVNYFIKILFCATENYGRELVGCTLDVVSVQVGRWCEGGTVRGGDFILCYGKGVQPAMTVFCRFKVSTFLSLALFDCCSSWLCCFNVPTMNHALT